MDEDSPAYVPSLFSFTDSSTKRQAEQALVRWKAAKRRCKDDEPEPTETEETTALATEDIDSMIIIDTNISISCNIERYK